MMKPVVIAIIGIILIASLGIMFFAKKPVVKTETGQTVNVKEEVGGEKLPDTFPKDFPIYQGAKIVSSAGLILTFTTPDGLDKVVPFYKNGLSASGWAITSSFDSDTIQTWEITKGATKGSVSITSERDKTTIQVELGNK